MKSLRQHIREGLRKKRITLSDGVYRFSQAVGPVPRGTVVVGKRVIYGFPKIRRIFSLGAGIGRNMNSPEFIAEEKIDGFNVRAALFGGKVMCFSRSGLVDHFCSEKLNMDEKVLGFLEAHPHAVLYGEMVGNTPHTPPTDEYDVKYLVFDIGNGRKRYLKALDRRKEGGKAGLEMVPFLGKFGKGDAEGLRKLARRLDAQGKEGMVLRGIGKRELMKYVVPSSDIHDLAQNSAQVFDMPAGFMKQRVFRSAISVNELGLDKRKYAQRLGEALHSGLEEMLASGGGEVRERFRVRVSSEDTWEKIKRQMGKEVRIEVESTKKSGKHIAIVFYKVYKEGSRRARRALEGYAQTD